MTTNMLAISSIFGGTFGADPALAEATAVKQRNRFSQSSLDDTPVFNDSGTETVDNTAVNDRDRLNTDSGGEFRHTFRREMTNEVSQKAKLSRNLQNQEQLFNEAGLPSVLQPLLARWSLKTGHGPKGIAKKVELKAGLERAQSVARLRPEKSPFPDGDTTKANDTKSVPFINQKQIGFKETTPKTSQALFSEENAKRVQMAEGRLLSAKGPDNEQNGEQPLIRARHRITTAAVKPEDVPVSNTFGSQKTPSLEGEGPKSQFVVNAAGEITNVNQKPPVAGKPGVPAARKKPLSNPDNLLVQDKPSGLRFKAVRIDPEKTPFIDENAAVNKTIYGQPILIQTRQFSGLLGGDVMEQGPNFPGYLGYQYLHRARLNVSAGPNKSRSGSISNNNSDLGFEQTLSGNNPTAFIEEQTSIFSEAVRTDNLSAQNVPNGVSASITEQILESIQSSSSQEAGTQQITIRLHPPELGKVFIKFEEQENQLTGLLEVSKAQTRYEVEQALPQIVQNLVGCGIQIKRLEVMLTDQNEQQSYGDESLQDGLFQQHHDLPEWDNPDQHGTIGANEPGIFENNSNYQDGLGPQMQITADSINILI